MSDGDQIDLHLTFPSPDGAAEIAAALAHAGFSDVRLYVVVEATATSDDGDLQLLHDRVKELGPMIEAANGGQVSHITRD
jgi:hypothetical protein